jgi:hypothetical protein
VSVPVTLLLPAGPSLRMFDAAAGWVVKRVRSRHMQAPGSPPQLAAVAGVFAALRHRSVVVPELLNALDAQVGGGVGCGVWGAGCAAVCVWGGSSRSAIAAVLTLEQYFQCGTSRARICGTQELCGSGVTSAMRSQRIQAIRNACMCD